MIDPNTIRYASAASEVAEGTCGCSREIAATTPSSAPPPINSSAMAMMGDFGSGARREYSDPAVHDSDPQSSTPTATMSMEPIGQTSSANPKPERETERHRRRRPASLGDHDPQRHGGDQKRG